MPKTAKLYKLYISKVRGEVQVRLVGRGPRGHMYTLDRLNVKDSEVERVLQSEDFSKVIAQHSISSYTV